MLNLAVFAHVAVQQVLPTSLSISIVLQFLLTLPDTCFSTIRIVALVHQLSFRLSSGHSPEPDVRPHHAHIAEYSGCADSKAS
jgi:hypothetical protein